MEMSNEEAIEDEESFEDSSKGYKEQQNFNNTQETSRSSIKRNVERFQEMEREVQINIKNEMTYKRFRQKYKEIKTTNNYESCQKQSLTFKNKFLIK